MTPAGPPPTTQQLVLNDSIVTSADETQPCAARLLPTHCAKATHPPVAHRLRFLNHMAGPGPIAILISDKRSPYSPGVLSTVIVFRASTCTQRKPRSEIAPQIY